MSDTSSPSVHIHPISPSSSTDSHSELHSELTSDEEPDLGAFTTVLREWTHLQPPPRIPVQIRTATSSTTPTFQPSVSGISDAHSNRSRNSGVSAVSSFTRPPSSSAHPEGSTVWAHAPIASYLYSGTPSNDDDESYESHGTEGEGEYTPNSMASTGLTVEIVSDTDFDQSNGQAAPSPYPYPSDSGISLPLTLESDNNRLDSREQEGDVGTSETSRGRPYTTVGQADSLLTSVQLQSQIRLPPTEEPSSSTAAVPSAVSVSDSPTTFSLNRSRNPEPPRTTSDSSYSASSSSLSLVSYQISETASMPNTEEFPSSNASADSSSVESASASMGLKTQRSVPSSSSASTTSFGTQRPQQHSAVQISQSSSLSSTGSPLPNPHSPVPVPEPELHVLSTPFSNARRPMLVTGLFRQDTIVNDLGTPDQPPSETLLFDPSRTHQPQLYPIVDDDDDDNVITQRHPTIERPNFNFAQHVTFPASADSAGYERSGMPRIVQESPYFQQQGNPQRHDRRELPNEDEDELDDPPHPTTIQSTLHGLGSRTIGPALTPRGIPAAPVEYARHPTITAAISDSVVKPPGYINQPLLKPTQDPDLPLQRQQEPSTQLHYPFQTNQSDSNMYTTASAMPTQSHSMNHQPSFASHVYTPRALPATQSSIPYIVQSHAYAASSQYSSSQDQSLTPPDAARSAHNYPYSLLGLHALPSSFSSHGTSTLPSISSFDSVAGTNGSQAPAWSELSDDNSTIDAQASRPHIETESIDLEEAVPSLGVLDGVLNFIAVERERARNNAVREGTTSTSTAARDDTHDAGSGEEAEAMEDEETAEMVEGEDDWKHIVEHEQDQPKRRRRRKRPPRAHANPITIVQALDVTGGTLTPAATPNTQDEHNVVPDASTQSTATTSPKKKKKLRNSANSLATSASASMVSLSLNGEGLKTPTMVRSEKEFLVPPPSSRREASVSKGKDTRPMILRRPDPGFLTPHTGSNDDDSDFDGGRTPTNFDTMANARPLALDALGLPIDLTGKKGKRVGRREREREKAKRDALRLDSGTGEGGGDNPVKDDDFDPAYEDDENDEGDGGGLQPQEDEGDPAGDNDSLSNLSLLKPPRRRRNHSRRRRARDTAHIHTIAGITGDYRSTPGTPGRLDEARISNYTQEQTKNEEDNDVLDTPLHDVQSTPEKRKRTRSKRVKPVTSVPDLLLAREPGVTGTSAIDDDTAHVATSKPKKGKARAAEVLGSEDILDMDRNQLQDYLITSGSSLVLMNSRPDKNQPPPDSKRGRLLNLARQLRDLFPEQREDLGRVISRIEKQGGPQGGKMKKLKSGDINDEVEASPSASQPISIPGSKRKTSRKGGFASVGSEGASADGDGFDVNDDQIDEEQNLDDPFDIEEEEEIDPRGRPPRRGDVLVHVFIDHSNILIGLLSHLKRTHAYRKNTANKARGRPLPAIINRATATSSTASNQTDAASSAFAAVKSTSGRPLPIPTNVDSTTTQQRSIPLPSFATMSHSLPTTSALNNHMESKDSGRLSDDVATPQERETNSDGYEYPNVATEESDVVDDSLLGGSLTKTKEKRYPRHLWHAALALILERGRPVSRRVVVTSSPLYQPMDAIERLGYELRVFIRVPDFGDGQDRERYKDKDKSSVSKSNGGSKSAQSSPANNAASSGLLPPTKKSKNAGHVRHLSGNTSTESGSGGGAGSTNAFGNGSYQPYYGTPNNTSQTRVKFREQGVDELLQLKLHQALAATDHVPAGSTIVLATGDGNVGQFNEDGFLGPVRTALRRGWRVELYAWEDGLSRAWKREFGDGSEWGRRGLFRVIAMEQFAHGLVEAIV